MKPPGAREGAGRGETLGTSSKDAKRAIKREENNFREATECCHMSKLKANKKQTNKQNRALHERLSKLTENFEKKKKGYTFIQNGYHVGSHDATRNLKTIKRSDWLSVFLPSNHFLSCLTFSFLFINNHN
ncbi:hypothetical protein P5673_003953 [Acropora cervicornis]|uniref:Uncharacterized protein n=1 Tax=Acropora cervicornis TaxID=6130 RepID=A0AAD9VEC5_ACRCE|nr:hypothetical protein P5673_003953 [Acropora cervicornis]